MPQPKLSFAKVAIIIVTWNGRHFLEKCLPSLKKLDYPSSKVKTIIVDNGSRDGTIAWLKENYPEIRVVKNKTNVGFAKSNNQGIRLALRDRKVKYVFTLNNDTEADTGMLKNSVLFMEGAKNVGIGASKTINFANRSLIDSAGDFFAKNTFRVINRGHLIKDRGQFDKTEEILSACAAASIFRRKTLEEVKLGREYFDEDFQSYIEDVDLNIRARLKGWKVFYIPSSVVYHVGSATASKLSKKFKEYVSRRNRVLMVVKNFPIPTMIFLLAKYILPTGRGARYYLAKRAQQVSKRGMGHYAKKGLTFYLKLVVERFIVTSDTQRLTVLEVLIVHIKALCAAGILLPKIIDKRATIQRGRGVSEESIQSWLSEFVIPY